MVKRFDSGWNVQHVTFVPDWLKQFRFGMAHRVFAMSFFASLLEGLLELTPSDSSLAVSSSFFRDHVDTTPSLLTVYICDQVAIVMLEDPDR